MIYNLRKNYGLGLYPNNETQQWKKNNNGPLQKVMNTIKRITIC
jgi:hypothetical protein